MSIIAAVAFRSALSGWSFVSAAAIGAIGASAIVLLAAWRRLLLGESVALSALGFVVLGGIAVGGVPTPGAYADFARGLVDGWADLLSSAPPADITQQLRALPFTVAWLSAAIGGEIARGSRRPGLPAIGPILALALSLLFTIEERWLALAQGAGILAGTLLLIAAGQRLAPRRFATLDEFDAGGRVGSNRVPPDARRRGRRRCRRRRPAASARTCRGPRPTSASTCAATRCPPFDPLAVPSPLAEVKASLKDDRKADVVFTVSGDTPVTRFPLAVLTDYDGVIWTVADPERDAAATEFVPVDTELPDLDDPLPDGADGRHEHGRDQGPRRQLPAHRRHRQAPRPADHRRRRAARPAPQPAHRHDRPARWGARRADVRGPLGGPAGRHRGAAARRRRSPPIDRSKELELLPPPVRNLAADLVEGRDAGWDQMAAIRDEFVNTGFYDATPDTPPGHSYGRIATMLADPARIVGFEEQYAAAAAVMAQVAGLPVRVVVGYEVSARRLAATARSMSPRTTSRRGSSSTPASSAGSPSTSRRTARAPPTPRRRAPRPSRWRSRTRRRLPRRRRTSSRRARRSARSTSRRSTRSPTRGAAVRAGRCGPSSTTAAVGLPLLLLLAFVAVVVGWKALRRRRRRTRPTTTGRIAGAWAEAIDRCTEAGAPRLTARHAPRADRGVRRRRRARAGRTRPAPTRRPGRPGRLRRRPRPATSTPPRRGAAATRSPPSCCGARASVRRLKMHLDPRPLRRDHATSGARPPGGER